MDEVFGDTTTTEEDLRDLAFGFVDCVDIKKRGTIVMDCFQPLNVAKIDISEGTGTNMCLGKVCTKKVGFIQVNLN